MTDTFSFNVNSDDLQKRSDHIKMGIHQAPARSLLYATGQVSNPEDMKKPFIAICNSYVEIIPGHVHLRELADVAKQAIRDAGGIPFEFNTIGVDDGIAMGHLGMRYSLPSRELIADSAETVITAHWFDGVFFLPNCDKITPGMIMASLRCNVPSVFVSGGPMKAGLDPQGKATTLSSMFEAVGAFKSGLMTEEEFLEMEQNACPTCGSCAGMFTANSMNTLMEVMGIALPFNGTALAISDERRDLIRDGAKQKKRLMMPWHLIWPWVAQPILFCTCCLSLMKLALIMTKQTLTKLLKKSLTYLKLPLLLNGQWKTCIMLVVCPLLLMN